MEATCNEHVMEWQLFFKWKKHLQFTFLKGMLEILSLYN